MMNATPPVWFAVLTLASLLGCSSSDNEVPQGNATGGAAGSDGGGSTAAGAAGSGGPAGALDAPDEAKALVAFLEARQYASWAKEADYHSSAGPHGGGVRVYYSPKAAAAVRSGAADLPAGAASVKELTNGGALYGYAVWVKVQDATDGGNGFYWYELIRQGGKDSVYGDARGSSDCVGCHSTGKDYNLSTLPFE
jgi:hypothetical protein